MDNVKLNEEPVSEVASRKTWTINVSESNDAVELIADEFAKEGTCVFIRCSACYSLLMLQISPRLVVAKEERPLEL